MNLLHGACALTALGPSPLVVVARWMCVNWIEGKWEGWSGQGKGRGGQGKGRGGSGKGRSAQSKGEECSKQRGGMEFLTVFTAELLLSYSVCPLHSRSHISLSLISHITSACLCTPHCTAASHS